MNDNVRNEAASETTDRIFFRKVLVALKRAVCRCHTYVRRIDASQPASGSNSLLRRGVLGDGLGAFTDGVLGQFTGEKQTDGRLDLAAGDGRSSVVVSKTRSLGGDALEDVVDEAVHDAHCLGADTGVWVHLLQDFVDVDGVRLSSSPLLLLVTRTSGLSLARGFLRSLASCCFRRHVCC